MTACLWAFGEHTHTHSGAAGRLMRTILYSTEHVSANNWETGLFILFLMVFAIAASAYVLYHGLQASCWSGAPSPLLPERFCFFDLSSIVTECRFACSQYAQDACMCCSHLSCRQQGLAAMLHHMQTKALCSTAHSFLDAAIQRLLLAHQLQAVLCRILTAAASSFS